MYIFRLVVVELGLNAATVGGEVLVVTTLIRFMACSCCGDTKACATGASTAMIAAAVINFIRMGTANNVNKQLFVSRMLSVIDDADEHQVATRSLSGAVKK